MQQDRYNILAVFQSYSHLVFSKQVDRLSIKTNFISLDVQALHLFWFN